MSAHRNWSRTKTSGKPTALPNTRFPKDQLGKRAKAAFLEWRQSLTPDQRRQLSARRPR